MYIYIYIYIHTYTYKAGRVALLVAVLDEGVPLQADSAELDDGLDASSLSGTTCLTLLV